MLEVSNLSCERDDRLLFSGLEFSLQPGQVIQLAGANGSGKTTLIRILSGLSSRYDGDIAWDGVPIEQKRLEFQASSLLLSHKPAIKLRLTALENLQFLAQSRDQQACVEALALVGLAGFEQVPCGQLSAGQQRRVGLARLYLSDHLFWLLDEPFTAIDLDGVKMFERLISQRASAGGMVLLTTHHTLELDVPFNRVEL